MFVTSRLTASPSIHIFDPQTGYPVETELASLTIISDRSVDGEIWTTRLFGEEPTNILNIVETLPGMDAILVYQSGRLAYTSGYMIICNFNFRKEFP